MSTPEPAMDRFRRWDLEAGIGASLEFEELAIELEFFEKRHYRQYVPTLRPVDKDFHGRLDDWLAQVPNEEQQQTMARMLRFFSFFGRDEFAALHRSAVRGPISRWIINEVDWSFIDSSFQEALRREIEEHTWYIGLTDSAKINEFYNVNGIGGIDLRPDCRALVDFGDPSRIVSYMDDHTRTGKPCPLHRVVVLEDFVGSGGQAANYLPKLARIVDPRPVLFVALIACPGGAQALRLQAAAQSNLDFAVVIEVPQSELIGEGVAGGNSLQARVRDVAKAVYPSVSHGASANGLPYGPFGFPPPDGTGTVLSLYSNTPANTLPLLHHESDRWIPLFPRAARVR